MTKILSVLLCAAVVIGLLPTGSCKKTTTVTDTVPPLGDTTNRHINDSLWAYYPLNGNLGDSSGNNHTLSLFSGAALGFDLWGNPNGALDFPGGAAYGSIADGVNFNSANFTVSLFAMYRQIPGLLLCKVNYSDATGSSFNVGVDPANYMDTMRFAVETATNICATPAGSAGLGGINMADPTQSIQPDAWYHVVMEVENGTMKLYMNGVLVQSQSTGVSALAMCSDAPFILGNWWTLDHNPALNGKIDDIRIYTRALKDNEIAYLFKNFMTH